MKTFKHLFLSVLSFSILASCSSDDDNPDPVNEEEIITTVRLELVPATGGDTVVFQSQDLDGEGPDAPVVTISGNISASTAYNGEIEFLNELESPAEDITLEVLEEGDEHQVFYTFTSGAAGSSVAYNDTDSDGNPIGVDITFNSGAASNNNTLVVVLRHEPSKTASGVSDGDITNAGGSTDAEVTFTYDVN